MSYGENGARLVVSSGKRRRLFRTTPKIHERFLRNVSSGVPKTNDPKPFSYQ